MIKMKGLLLFIIVFVFSCQHENTKISIEKRQIASTIDIEEMVFISNDTFLLCGGIRAEKGEIFRSCDAGANWQKLYEGKDKLYSFYFFPDNNEAIAVGDCTHVQKSFDRGATWTKKIDCSYLWTNDRTSFRKISFYDGKGGIAIGNQSREYGNAMFSWDRGDSWQDVQGNNGLNDWWIFNNDSLIAVGYGIVEKITHNWQQGYRGYLPTVTVLPFSGDYFTGIWFTNNTVGYMSGFDGGIYKTKDAGIHWTEIYKRNSILRNRIHFNDVLFESETVGWVSGQNGLLMKTTDAGHSWVKIKTNFSDNLKSLFYYNHTLYISSENGNYFVITE